MDYFLLSLFFILRFWNRINEKCHRNISVSCVSFDKQYFLKIFLVVYLVSGIIVGGFGGCCGTIRPRRVGTRCGSDISPADLNDMMPVPLLISSPFECDVKQTRPP